MLIHMVGTEESMHAYRHRHGRCKVDALLASS